MEWITVSELIKNRAGDYRFCLCVNDWNCNIFLRKEVDLFQELRLIIQIIIFCYIRFCKTAGMYSIILFIRQLRKCMSFCCFFLVFGHSLNFYEGLHFFFRFFFILLNGLK